MFKVGKDYYVKDWVHVFIYLVELTDTATQTVWPKAQLIVMIGTVTIVSCNKMSSSHISWSQP